MVSMRKFTILTHSKSCELKLYFFSKFGVNPAVGVYINQIHNNVHDEKFPLGNNFNIFF